MRRALVMVAIAALAGAPGAALANEEIQVGAPDCYVEVSYPWPLINGTNPPWLGEWMPPGAGMHCPILPG